MKKYSVTLYFHTNCEVEVEAENEKEAKLKGYAMLGNKKVEEQIMEGLQEDSSPDIVELK